MSPMLEPLVPQSPTFSRMNSESSHHSPAASSRPHTLSHSRSRAPLFQHHASFTPARHSESSRDSFNFSALIHSCFNPLRYCETTIVDGFAKASSRLHMVDCFSIISLNKKLALKRRKIPQLTGRQVCDARVYVETHSAFCNQRSRCADVMKHAFILA